MKSIGFIMLHFLIFFPSLFRLALCTECITVKAEMVGLDHTRCRFNIFKTILSQIFIDLSIYFFISYFACNLLMAWSQNNNKKRDIYLYSINGLVLEISILSHMRNTDG